MSHLSLLDVEEWLSALAWPARALIFYRSSSQSEAKAACHGAELWAQLLPWLLIRIVDGQDLTMARAAEIAAVENNK